MNSDVRVTFRGIRHACGTALLATTAVAALAACGANGADPGAPAPAAVTTASTAPTPQAQHGDLIVSGGFIPQPASPDVVSAYLTVTNTGAAADALTAVSTDAGGTATLHRTVGGAMVPLGELDVPAHASAAFSPGANHIMIDNPTRRLVKGDHVTLTLAFTRAGTFTVDVPVTGYPTGGSSDDMGGMTMSGMAGGATPITAADDELGCAPKSTRAATTS